MASCQLFKFCGMTEMAMKQKKSKFSLVAPQMKAMLTCPPDLANVIQLTSNLHKQCGSLVHIQMFGFKENNLLYYITNDLSSGAEGAQKWNVNA